MKQFRVLLMFVLAIAPLAGLAHEGAGAHQGLLHGLSHPLGGLDHLVAMIAVGLWAKQLGGRAVWGVPAVFLMVMLGGALLGWSGVGVPSLETGIAASVLVMGLLVASACQLPMAISCLLVGGFALFHGNAHGLELPMAVSVTGYVIGFAVATFTLHLSGIAAGSMLARHNLDKVVRAVGAAIAVTGLCLGLA